MDDILAELPTLVRLAQTSSVSRTARDLGVPRSTISRRLARLEAALGVTLAERTTRSFRLTEEGRMLAEGATQALARLQTLRETVERASGDVRGWLRVCTPPGLGGPLVGRFLVAFRERFPEVRVELTVREHVPHLLDEPFDVVFAVGPLQDAPWVRHFIGEVRHLAVAHPDYLATRGHPKTIDDLQNHVLMSLRTDARDAERWPTYDGPDLAVSPHFVSTDLAAVVNAARSAMGIAFVPIHLVAEDLAEGRLQTILPDALGHHDRVYLLYAPERRDSPVIRSLLGSVDAFGTSVEQELKRTPGHPS